MSQPKSLDPDRVRLMAMVEPIHSPGTSTVTGWQSRVLYESKPGDPDGASFYIVAAAHPRWTEATQQVLCAPEKIRVHGDNVYPNPCRWQRKLVIRGKP